MNQYAKVFKTGDYWEVRCSSVLPVGFWKTKQDADRQAYAINMRRAESSRNYRSRGSRKAA